MKMVKVGITANLQINETNGSMRSCVNQNYVDSVEKAGGVSVVLPVVHTYDEVKLQLKGLDGVILSGGYDIDPVLYGSDVHDKCGFFLKEVDDFYMNVIKAAEEMGLPVFGICKGIQAINVYYGGTLYQDLQSEMDGAIMHWQKTLRGNPVHSVTVKKDSFLGSVFKDGVRVNSFHHQGVKNVAPGFRITARANDGLVEGIEKKKGNFTVGVQFHPEMMAEFENEDMIHLFEAFLKECEKA